MTTPDLERAREIVERVHGRYQREIVEQLNICPFARKSREQGRVHRPIYLPQHEAVDPTRVATELLARVDAHADAEIVLLTFAVGPAHEFAQADAFEAFLKALREAWEGQGEVPPWYMVSFHPHPRVDLERAPTRDSLVPLLRRSPDPVIQCVNARVLDEVRREAQRVSHARMLAELREKSPELAELFAHSVQADPELGADIAQHNFDHYGVDEGRARLESTLADIHAERERVYAELGLGLEGLIPSPPA